MWATAKSLNGLVVDTICNRKESKILELEKALSSHKNMLLFPLQLTNKNADHREAVKKAVHEPIGIPDTDQRILLNQDFVDEVLILSDLFNTDELLIIELLLTAEGQLPFNAHLSRGLLAVLLFYEARQSLVDCLRTLIQARSGQTQSHSASSELIHLAAKYTENLWAEGLLSNLLNSLLDFDVHMQLSRLDGAQALGPPRHRHDVHNLLNNIHNGLAECVLLWACQTPFNLTEIKLVVDSLLRSTCTISTPVAEGVCRPPSTSVHNEMSLSHGQCHLLMALMYTLQPFALSGPVEQLNDLADFAHPLFTDRHFARGVSDLLDAHRDMYDLATGADYSDQLAVIALLRLCWAVCLRCTSQLRSELCRRDRAQTTESSVASPHTCRGESDRIQDANDFGSDEDDEIHTNLAIESGALEFARKRLLAVAGFEREMLWVCCLHNLVTDLLIYMPGCIKEMRLRDEDLIRRTGFDPSSSGSGFANFLLLIAELYDHPGSRLHARLALEYWWPAGEVAAATATAAVATSNTADMLLKRRFASRSPSKLNTISTAIRTADFENFRQTSLFRFIRSSGDMVGTSTLFIPYVRMLHGLVGSRSSANLCFSLLKANAGPPGRAASLISWDHFFASFSQYLNHMKQPNVPIPAHHQSTTHALHQIHPHLYNASTALNQRAVTTGTASSRTPIIGGAASIGVTSTNAVSGSVVRAIQPEEQAGLRVVLRLISRIAFMDSVARSIFASNNTWQVVPTFLGLISCPIPCALKADLIHVLTSLSRSAPIGAVIWRHITSPELFSVAQRRHDSNTPVPCGLHTEMDEIEPRAEEYPITRAFLSLITVLAPQLLYLPGTGSKTSDPREIVPDDNLMQQSVLLTSVVTFLINSVFLKHTMRAYRDPSERWDVAAACLVFFDGLIEQFVRTLDAVVTATLCCTDAERKDQSGPSVIPVAMEKSIMPKNNASTNSPDWASILLDSLWNLASGSTAAVRNRSSLAELFATLHLPPGWPQTDPGFLLSAQLLSDSSLFRTLTGLLEVGLHRILEFPIPDGPAPGIVRATSAGLRILTRMLASEDVLTTLMRRITLGPFLIPQVSIASNISAPFWFSSQNDMPVCMSRLLMSINSRTGRADLLPMLLQYCTLHTLLPDHCASSLQILGFLVGRIKPHTDLLSLLIADEASQRRLMSAFASLLAWPTKTDVIVYTDVNSNDVLRESDVNISAHSFTDDWLFDEAGSMDMTQLTCLGVSSGCMPHPASMTARWFASLPSQPAHWYFPSREWEFLSAWPSDKPSVLAPIADGDSQCLQFGSYTIPGKYGHFGVGVWLFAWMLGHHPQSLGWRLLHILLMALDQPAPNIAHWLFGFRVESPRSVACTTLQDAGIADQPRTCLHAILDLLDTGLRLGSTISVLPQHIALTLQLSLSMSWQIIYRLASVSSTSEPLLRFLRSNHSLLSKQLQLSLQKPFAFFTDPGQKVFRDLFKLLSLNQVNWFLRTLAIEMRIAAAANQRSYLLKLLNLFFGDLLATGSEREIPNGAEATSALRSILCQVEVSEPVSTPNVFELRSFDSSLIDELLDGCEMVSPLLASDSSTTRRVSTLLDPKTFFNRLYLKLLANRDCANITSADDLASLFQMVYQNKLGATLPKLTHLEHTAADIIAQDLINLRRWIESRNMHRLYLFAGKQATFEAWREVVEVSFWILAKSSTTPTLSLQPSSSVLSHLGDIGSLTDQYLSSSNSFRGSGFHTLCLAVLNQLLTELCVTEHCPPSIRLLASGTLLHIASFLNSDELAFDCGDNSSALCVKELAGQLTRIVYSLTELLLQTKPSSQRMRANLYGCLGYLLRFGRFMASQENRDSRGTSLILPECLSAMHSAANPSSHWARTNVAHLTELTDAFALHCLLVCDLIQSHAITQMAAFTFSELLITFDRSTRDLTSFLCQRTILQHLVDSTIEDLASVESFITSTASGFADENECVVDGTTNMSSAAISAFHLYRAKLSLLCRLATTTSGAKALILSGVINSLADRAIFSAFDVSNFYADTLDILCGTPERQHCKWLDFSSVLHTVTRLHSDINVLPDTAIFRKLLTSVTEKSREENEVHLSWSGVVLPTVALLKSILITLGPAHLCANQQVLNFLYTHSGSLITDETALGNTLSYFLNHSPDTISRRGFSCLTQWLAMEVCLTEVFVLISCTHIAGLDEFSALQREVVQSRIIRHVLCLLPAIFLDDPSVIGRSATEKPSPHRGTLGLEYLLCETQQVQLMHQLISVCVAAGGGSELTSVGSKSTKERVLGTLMGHLINVDAKDPLASMVLFMQALSWSLARLSRFEELCWCLSNLSLFEQSDAAESSEGLPKGEDRYTEKVSTHILHRRMPFKNGKLTTNELRQAYSIIFNGDSTTSTPATNSSGIDGYQRELSYLQANVSVGLCLIRVQLRFLATLCQKIAYIVWRYMDYYMNSVESPTKQTPTPVIQQPLSIRRLGSDSLAGALSTKSPRRTDLTDVQKAELKPDRSTIKQRLLSLLKPEVMTGLARLSEASYLNPNERLFIQVMKHRLERLVPRTTAEG